MDWEKQLTFSNRPGSSMDSSQRPVEDKEEENPLSNLSSTLKHISKIMDRVIVCPSSNDPKVDDILWSETDYKLGKTLSAANQHGFVT